MTGAGYGGLFVTAFLAATLLPLSSEAVLAALSAADGFDLFVLIAVATVGNTLGALVNWLLGRFCLRWRERRWFPVDAARLETASARFRRYGVWSLLLAWVPVIGDPLTFIAGILGVRLAYFLPLVALGKAARYAVVAGFARTLFG